MNGIPYSLSREMRGRYLSCYKTLAAAVHEEGQRFCENLRARKFLLGSCINGVESEYCGYDCGED